MTDELVKRLRAYNDESFVETLCGEAADRIEALTAEREALEQDNHRWKMECENFWRDREKDLTAERDAVQELYDAGNKYWNPVYEKVLHRAEAAEAERDRLKKALEDIIADCEADYPPSHGAIKYAAKLALKGASHE